MAQTGKNSFLPDRFDDVSSDSKYAGTHRRQQSSWSLFAPIGIALGVVVILVLAGLWFVDRSDDYLALDPADVPGLSGEVPGEEPGEEPVVVEPEAPPAESEPVVDPTQIDTEGLTITILNGTGTAGLAARANDRLVSVGWPETTATNADSSDVAESLVAYSEEADRAIALGIAQLLGIDSGSVIQTETYPGARVTIILGANYVDTEST